MPRSPRFTREQVTDAAFGMVRTHGRTALTARALAADLGCSVKPIFGLFDGMEDVQEAVWRRATRCYEEHLRVCMASDRYPPYMASGMGYITFAQQEPELFKLLFMCDQTDGQRRHMEEQARPIIDLIGRQLGVDHETASEFHMSMWVFVHGIASMIVTHYLDWDTGHIEAALSSMFLALRDHTLARRG